MDLAHRALRPRRPARFHPGPDPLVRPVADPLLTQHLHQALAHQRILPTARVTLGADSPGQLDQALGTASADPIDTTRARARDHLALPRQCWFPTFQPSLTSPTRWLSGTRASLEEDLVEVDLPGDMPERADLHTGHVHVDEEIGDPLTLGSVSIGPGQEHPEVGQVGPRVPHLLSGDHPLVAVTLGPGGQRCQIRTRPRLAEQLAPDLLVAHDGTEERRRCSSVPRRRGPERPD